MSDDIWKIKDIFDGDYGCEERPDGVGTMVLVTLVNETGEEKHISVEDEYLIKNNLDIGSLWQE